MVLQYYFSFRDLEEIIFHIQGVLLRKNITFEQKIGYLAKLNERTIWISETILFADVTAKTSTKKDRLNITEIKIHKPSCIPDIPYTNCSTILKADKIKYLGLFLDQCIHWNKHRLYSVKIGQIYKLQILPPQKHF